MLGGALAAGGVLTAPPAFLRGQNLNDKLNIAMIACGGRANANAPEADQFIRRPYRKGWDGILI